MHVMEVRVLYSIVFLGVNKKAKINIALWLCQILLFMTILELNQHKVLVQFVYYWDQIHRLNLNHNVFHILTINMIFINRI